MCAVLRDVSAVERRGRGRDPFSVFRSRAIEIYFEKSIYLCVRQMDGQGKINLWLARHRISLTVFVEDSRAARLYARLTPIQLSEIKLKQLRVRDIREGIQARLNFQNTGKSSSPRSLK
jgi:hypothetical protein